ncbi:MAG: AIPR family protein [Lachnoclostridium sp.]|nr:AIPR family protein [Lachnospira sp.]MCM1248263.1 AIPR family protein [Lachnoclostridium sp.]
MNNTQIILKDIISKEYTEQETYLTIEKFFEFYSAKQILKNYVISDEDIEQRVLGSGNDGGCDSIFLFCNGVLVKEDFIENINIPIDSTLEFIVIQSKTSTSFGEDVIMKWKTLCENLLDLNNSVSSFSSRYNKDVLDNFQLFRDIYTSLIRKRIKLSFIFYYASEGVEIHPNVKQQGNELEGKIKKLFPSSKFLIEYFGADKLLTAISNPIIQDYELNLAETPISLGQNTYYVALVSLNDYYNFITNDKGTLNQLIFEANIRDYQGNVIVNKEIFNTLSSSSADDFWWFNNGITILASKIVPMTSKTLVLTDPEIVNGLQTSNEIYNYFSSNISALTSDTRHVLVRIIVPTSETIRDKIILATNNQTTIPKASLRSSDAIHWQIEMYFKQHGLYYDRRKNFYKNQGKKSNEIVSVSYLAQSLISVLLQKPNYSRARPSTLLTNDEYYDALYHSNIDIEVYYKIIIWANKIKNFLKRDASLDITTQGDLLFYVLYYAFAKKADSKIILANDIKEMDIDLLTDTDIQNFVSHIYEIYQLNGGDSKAAKGSAIIESLMNEF